MLLGIFIQITKMPTNGRSYNKKIYKSYNFKTRRGVRKTRYSRKKKSFMSKLRDKKINTLFEVRAKEIAVKADQKAIEYYYTRGVWLAAGAHPWPVNDTNPPPADWGYVLDNQFYSREFCKIGGYLAADLSTEVQDDMQPPAQPLTFRGERELMLHIKQIKIAFEFLNLGHTNVTVDFSVWRVPYNKYLLSTDNLPDAMKNPVPSYFDHAPMTIYNQITSAATADWRSSNANIKIQKERVAHARLVIKPGRMVDDPAAGGGSRINTEVWHKLTINKKYKGLGKAEKYTLTPQTISPVSTAGSLSEHRYFFCFRTFNGNLSFRGVSSVKFCKGKNVPENIIFDAGAPNAL